MLNGLQPLSIQYKLSPYDGKYKRVAWAVASAKELKPSLSSVNSFDTKALIHPTAITKLKRRYENFLLMGILNLPLTIKKKIKFFRQVKA
ncbi:MAG: hypothetical protein WKG06_39865 [Segetibacter sp.]